MVDPALFATEMERRWLAFPSTHARVCTPALRRLWTRFAEIFNGQLHADGGPRPVIPAELGAGKSTAMKVWCSLLPFDAHPGVLIVVRTIRDAEQVAADVNLWSERSDMAFAYHHELDAAVKRDLAGLARWPVLVICHKGYETSLDRFAMLDSHAKFDAMHRFRDGRRRQIVFVDESLDLVYQARLSESDLQYAVSKIPRAVARTHAEAHDVLDSVARALRLAPADRRVVLTARDILARTAATPETADELLRAMWESIALAKHMRGVGKGAAKGDKVTIDRRARLRVGEVISAIRAHLALYRWADGDATIAGSRLLLPPEAALVVLDASGKLNSIYQRSSYYRVLDDLEPVRDYRAAAHYVIRAYGTGIRAMEGRAEQIARDTLKVVLDHYGDRARERRVLLITNKDSVVSKKDQSHQTVTREIWEKAGFASLDVVWWGDIDGRNDLAHCDTLVTLTLPYATSSHDLAVYLALTGAELDGDGLNDPPDDVRVLREVRVAGQLAQAIGRTCVRDLTREDGVCEPADVFSRLPNWDKVIRTDAVLDHVRRVLRGIQVVELAREPTVDWVGQFGPLFTTPGMLTKPATLSKRAWMRLLKDAGRPGGQLNGVVAAAGLEIASAGGRLYVQAKGAGDALTPPERRILDFALGLAPGTEAPLAGCGLPEDARRRAVRSPKLAPLFKSFGVRVDVRGPTVGGVTLVRP